MFTSKIAPISQAAGQFVHANNFNRLGRGLIANRFMMDVTSANISNAHSISMNGKEAERRQFLIIKGGANGPEIVKIEADQSPLPEHYEPYNPHADSRGYVKRTNINEIKERVNMHSAARAYEMNVMGINLEKSMNKKALEIGR